MGKDSLPAPVNHYRHAAERHCQWPAFRGASTLRPGLGEGPAGPCRRLQARGVWPGHGVDACPALWLYPDDQYGDPDELLLQDALRTGPHALPERDRARPEPV